MSWPAAAPSRIAASAEPAGMGPPATTVGTCTVPRDASPITYVFQSPCPSDGRTGTVPCETRTGPDTSCHSRAHAPDQEPVRLDGLERGAELDPHPRVGSQPWHYEDLLAASGLRRELGLGSEQQDPRAPGRQDVSRSHPDAVGAPDRDGLLVRDGWAPVQPLGQPLRRSATRGRSMPGMSGVAPTEPVAITTASGPIRSTRATSARVDSDTSTFRRSSSGAVPVEQAPELGPSRQPRGEPVLTADLGLLLDEQHLVPALGGRSRASRPAGPAPMTSTRRRAAGGGGTGTHSRPVSGLARHQIGWWVGW